MPVEILQLDDALHRWSRIGILFLFRPDQDRPNAVPLELLPKEGLAPVAGTKRWGQLRICKGEAAPASTLCTKRGGFLRRRSWKDQM
jgi:hypothetical protein